MNRTKALLCAVAAIIILHGTALSQAPTIEGSEYKYLYRLDKQQVRLMIDSPWFSANNPITTQPIDSIYAANDFSLNRYRRGYYLTAKANDLIINTQLLIHQPFFPIVQETNGVWWVVIKDTLQSIVKDGVLTLIQSNGKDTVFSYDSSCMCYPVPLQKKDHWFLFERGSEFYYINIASPYKKIKRECTRPWYKFWKKCRPVPYYNSGYDYYYRPNRIRRFFSWVGRKFTRPATLMQLNPGYIVINQPEFKQLDTLKMKSFLVNRKGKPLKKELYVKVFPTNEYYKPLLNQKIKPLTAGAYVYEMAIPDTFLIDRFYTIGLYDKKGRAYKTQNFKVADYELKKVSYSWEKTLGEYYRGNDIIFYAKSVDANNLPLPDATVRLKLKITSVNNVYDSLVTLHDSVFTTYYDTLLACSPDGLTPIQLPAHLIPNADISVQGEMIFTNADNQPGHASAYFSIMADSKRYYLVPDSNGLRAGFLIQGRDIKGGKARWRVNYNSGVSKEKEITLPYYQDWEPGASSYYLMDSVGTSAISNYSMPVNIPNVPTFAVNKAYDSLHIELNNPLGIELGWRIFSGKKLIGKGAGRQFNLHQKLKGNQPVYVIYSYTWAGNFFTYETIAWAKEKQLTVKIEQPDIVYPGQEIAVDITVTDYKNKTAKNVNLTAYSVNMEFNNISTPQLPYYGKSYGGMLTTKSITGVSEWVSEYGYYQSLRLNDYLFNKLQLGHQPYYKLLYAHKAVGMVTDSLANGKTQLSVFVKTNTTSYKDYFALWIDGKMAYYRIQSGYAPNAFRVSPGKHKIQFRGFDGMYELDSVECVKGMRTLVGINLDSIYNNRSITRTEYKEGLVKEERELYRPNLLFIGPNYGYNVSDTLINAYFKQEGKIYSMAGRYYSYGQGNYQYYAVGPFEKGWVDMVLKDTVITFYFNTEYLYLYAGKHVFSYDINYADYSPQGLSSVCSYKDTATELPRPPKEEPKVNIIKNYNTTNPFQHPGIRNYNPPYWHGKGAFYLIYPTGNTTPSRIWFINRDDIENSTIVNDIRYNSSHRIKPGNYDILLITDTNSYKLLRNVRITDSLHTYFRPSTKGYADYDSVMLLPYLTQVKILNRGPIPQFYKTPMKLVVKLDKENTKNPERLIGEFSINGQYIYNALVVIEDGKGNYVNGGLSNEYGFYQVPALPGNYVMKVFTPQWGMFFVENVKIATGQNTIANLNINNYSTEVQTINYNNLPVSQRREQLGHNGKQPDYKNTIDGTCIAACGEIRGVVKDAKTGEEIIGASIFIENTNMGIATDLDGSYRIKNLSPGTYTLLYQLVGYQTLKIVSINVKADQITFTDALLRENTMELNEVMITEKARTPIVKGDELGVTSYSYSAAPAQMMSVETISSSRKRGKYKNGVGEENEESYEDGEDFNPFRGNVFSVDKDGVEDDVNRSSESVRLQRMLGDTNALKVRKTFRDYGYWVSNLITNNKGKAGFTVRLPDNQTQWVSYVPAMDGKRRSGLGISYMKAYKPLTGNLSIPRVMVAEDKLLITGKTVNYTADSVVVNALLRVNDSDLYNSPLGVRYYQLVQQFLQPAQAGETVVQYSIKTESGYTDGEIRSVPVLENGLLVNKGETRTLEGDVAFTLFPQEGQKNRELLITNRKLETLQTEIDKLVNYQYGCVEQTASKLKALLLQKQFAKALGKEFKDEKLISTCIKRLEKFQNPDGSWGWWDKTVADQWMTLYATDALLRASTSGYKTKSALNGASYLWSSYPSLSYNTKVASLEIFIKAGYGTANDKIAALDTLNLTLQQRYSLMKAKQLAGQKISTDTLLKTVHYIGDKQAAWGEKIFTLSVNELQTSAIAYEILRTEGGHDSLLKKVRSYFLSVPHTSRNTIESATVLQTFMQDIADEDTKKQELQPELTINGKTPVLPLLMKVGETETVSISKKGSELFYVYSWQNFIKNPEKDTSAFKVSTQLEQGGKISDTVEAGKPVTLKISVTVEKDREYMMLEVPVPAGFSYQTKKTGYRELYREHFDDKVAIFFDKLPRGKYSFTIELLPKFKGEVTLLPARAEEMYFPLNFGNNTKRKVLIK